MTFTDNSTSESPKEPKRRRPTLAKSDREVHRHLLEGMTFELIPLKSLDDQIRFVPTGSTVSMTCSPNKTIEDTLDLCERLGNYGFSTIPHLAARMVEGEAHVDQILARITGLGIRKVLFIGGDAEPHGPFTDAAAFLRSFLDRKPDIDVVGIGSYPDGHSTIPDDALVAALLEKQELIAAAGLEGYMSTQMCFDHQKIGSWLADRRSAGVTLPCHLGVPGAVDRTRLLTISMRLGIGTSARYLKKNRTSVLRLLSPGGYNPNKLIAPLSKRATELGITGVHCFTFNAVDTTEDWRQKTLAGLEC
ncbi:MAG TPA: 5,10-methylenetetrahydrofolate reductase [Acidimicrobiaceae bacterium]|nr:5,10-methylenetetrahydrofolate reductase [Acidimicrobiaceae bacterium]MDP7258896.1 methylenetetrahydrofolate reductase [Acidimicrobiales bacterium]HCV36862.1 5,10-methylenetetrahydrofolate reductase [Acidimicrobiaceae bacterium]HJO80631.1 methylenetetrahydrofolate reductase [Acidimicrobiales bacterium]